MRRLKNISAPDPAKGWAAMRSCDLKLSGEQVSSLRTSVELTAQTRPMIIDRLLENINLEPMELNMPGRTPRRSWFVIFLTLLTTLQTATPAWAWGRLGHRVISRLAKKHMTEKARDALAELLDPSETIADASTWADEYCRGHRETAPWHYVDVPLDEPKYDAKWSADDPKKGCVVDKINEFRAVLKDKSKTVEERRFALRFLIHCIEDNCTHALSCR